MRDWHSQEFIDSADWNISCPLRNEHSFEGRLGLQEKKGRLGMKPIKSNRHITIGMRVVVVLFLLLPAGESFAQKVDVDFDKDVDFSKYKTYAFTEGTPTPVTLTNQRI